MEIRRSDIFDKWLKNLADTVGKFKIDARIRRLEEGLFGDVKHVGGGVFEMRVHHGPGYRVYYSRMGDQIIILLCGGDKSTQRSDIANAKKMVKEIENA
ncbi:MAG: type II toxin-antitoxin system RelE/ParE family toxin [Planctomycetaceae bacterium]|nr:type II toxin-antitoxin system RelE/ParE family toxin [Planctomycetaceae bacterium]